MKTTFHQLLLRGIIPASLLILSACSNPAEERIRSVIDTYNSSCPATIANTYTFESAVYDNNNIVFTISTVDAFADFTRQMNGNELKEKTLLSIAQQFDEQFLQDIEETEAGLTLLYTDSKGNELQRLAYDSKEIIRTAEKLKNGEIKRPSLLERMKNDIEKNAASLPIKMEDGTTLEKIEMDGTTITYYYRVDSNDNECPDEQSVAEWRSAMLQQLRQMHANNVEDIHKDSISFRYIHRNNNDFTLQDVTFTPDEF